MSKFQCHYECLKVTRDAPAEVIRAAYRSLSQKHHPDKNVGDQDAARVMARLNYAYSVLSDPAQRALYDAQLMHEQHARDHYGAGDDADFAAPRAGSGRTWLNRISLYAIGRKGRIAAAVTFVVLIGGGLILRSVWKEQQSMLMLEQAALPTAGSSGVGISQAPAHVAAPTGAPGTDVVATPAEPLPAPAAPAAVVKTSEFERLTVLLKSMGLGLHKLDVPEQPPAARRPASPAQPAEQDKAAVAANAAAAPPARPQASAAVMAPEVARPREEAERSPAPEAGRANVAQAAVANAPGAALRQAVIADARSCAPSYPARAYSNGESGTVQLALLVGGDGGVLESKVQKSSGHAELDKAARRALSQCHFKVAGNERSAEPVWANVEYAFSLD